ncbi:MAG: FliH/SctL family protein [Planctomycetota bacterium]
MAVIKSTHSGKLLQDAIVLDLGDLRREAERLEARAREQASAILDEARAERERIIEGADAQGHTEGHERGLAEGREAGLAEGRTQGIQSMEELLTRLSAQWEGALGGFLEQREQILSDARMDVLRLATLIASRVTKRVIEIDPKVAEAQLEAALRLVLQPTRLLITVHPEDHVLIAEVLPTLVQRFGNDLHTQVHEDASLERGSCVLRTDRGEVDASIDGQLERMIDALLPRQTLADASSPAAPEVEP